MLKQKKLPKEVLEELKANPNISENMLEVARHTTIRDEGGERINGNNNDIKLPDVIETGVTVGDLLK